MNTASAATEETAVTEPKPADHTPENLGRDEDDQEAFVRPLTPTEAEALDRIEGRPARDDDYTPEAVDRDQATEEPTAVAAFLQAIVSEVHQTSGMAARRTILRNMADARYPHLVRVAMGDLLTTVANYATDPEMVQALRQDTEAAVEDAARRSAITQDEAEERIYRNGGPNP